VRGGLTGATNRNPLKSGDTNLVRSYSCSLPSQCAGIGISTDLVEETIVAAVLYRLERRPRIAPKGASPVEASKELVAAYEHHGDALRTLATDYYVAHRLTRDEWKTA
jgi:hypothetical protein